MMEVRRKEEVEGAFSLAAASFLARLLSLTHLDLAS